MFLPIFVKRGKNCIFSCFLGHLGINWRGVWIGSIGGRIGSIWGVGGSIGQKNKKICVF